MRKGKDSSPAIVLFASIIALSAAALSAGGTTTKPGQWDGSRVVPVHRIPLKDEFGVTIIPTEKNPPPFSARTTCAPCHDYDVIRAGWHFNAGTPAPSGRPGEPWVWTDERTGTQIPLSFRAWKGVFSPAGLDLSAWDFTLLFGRHLPGGGVAEPADKDLTPESRWNVSGKVEINCLGCHNAGRSQDHGEWAKQILRENFRWAASAAAGLGEVGGMSSRLSPTWDLFDGPNPDDSEWAVAPWVRYDKTLFDGKHRAWLDVGAKPDDDRCLVCHAATPAAIKKFEFDEDVHTAAGLRCVSCHRNDVSHAVIRGYEGEKTDNPALVSEEFTCRGCHLGGKASPGTGAKIVPGRLGAPYPRHNGIPKVHLDRLSCTACHSGPPPAAEPVRARTSRANRLGIYGVANWVTEMPAIVQPVFVRDTNGKLTPHRLMWPAYWAKIVADRPEPLHPEAVLAAAGDVLFPERTVTRILTALFNTTDLVGIPVLVMDGRVYEANLDGGLDGSAAAEGARRGLWWGVKDGGEVSPLIPDFDPNDPEKSVDPETLIQKVLEALRATEAAPGEPVLIYKGYRYKIIESQVEKAEAKEDAETQGLLFWLKDERRLPFVPEFEARTISALTDSETTLTEEQVRLILEALAGKSAAETVEDRAAYAYLAGGKLFTLAPDGKIGSRNHKAAEPVAWPLAHEVRPAQQALGSKGCTDCHTAGSDFFFAEVRGQGPIQTRNVSVRPASAYMDLTVPYHLLFGLSFTVRPFFKIVLAVAALAIGAVLLAAGLLAVGRAAGLTEKRR